MSIQMFASSFSADENPIGPRGLQVVYSTATQRMLLTQLYANLVLGQPMLDLQGASWSAAVNAPQYQDQMKRQAQYFLNQIMPSYIRMITDLDNFITLANISLKSPLILQLPSNSFGTVMESLADQADSIHTDATALNNRMTAMAMSVDTPKTAYEKGLADSIKSFGKKAKDLTDQIEKLDNGNRDAIGNVVSSGRQFGKGVSELLDTVSQPLVSEKPEAPNSGTVLTYINAVSDGIAGMDDALNQLRKNNAALQTAYQNLAKVNMQLTVAAFVLNQTDLFLGTFQLAMGDVHNLVMDWADIKTEFDDYAQAVQASGDPKLSVDAKGARGLWTSMSSDVTYFKTILTQL